MRCRGLFEVHRHSRAPGGRSAATGGAASADTRPARVATAGGMSEAGEAREAEEGERQYTARYEGDRGAAERDRHVGLDEPLAQARK